MERGSDDEEILTRPLGGKSDENETVGENRNRGIQEGRKKIIIVVQPEN